jgi:DUF4097 and DUF4098 domain-containing protein YvlB
MKIWKPSLTALTVLAVCTTAVAQGANERGIISLSDPTRPATVHLGLVQGSITVRGTDRKDVLVEANVEDEGDDKPGRPDAKGLRRIPQRAPLTVEEENNRVAINAGSPNRFYNFIIEVPVKTNLEVSTINGGEVAVEGVDGELEIGNVNGGITLTRVGGAVVAHTTNGDVHVSLVRVTPQKSMAFTTLNGDIDVTVPPSTKANLRLRSDQGEIFTDFELKVLPESAMPTIEDTRKEGGRYRIEINKALAGAINGGGPDFELRSFAGDIYVRSAGK